MVKVKEFCCGCTLRTGTLILAWSVLIWNCLVLLMTSIYLILLIRGDEKYYPPPNSKREPIGPSRNILVFLFVEAIIAIVICITAMWAVQKKRTKYLNGLFWYFCYTAVIYATDAILEIFDVEIAQDSLQELGIGTNNYKVLNFLINLFAIAFALYFALVVKSHRDYALKNEILRDDVETPSQTNNGFMDD